MRNTFLRLLPILAILSAASCASPKKFVYLYDMKAGKDYPIDSRFEATIQIDDRLDIVVGSRNPELAVPFNAMGGTFSISDNGEVTPSAVAGAGKGYRVDAHGNIDFPILGKIHLAGLKVSEAKNLIRDLIIDGDYIKAPIVSIEFLNFKYTVFGAVGGNGSYSMNGDRITLLEAIANAGDLTRAARLDRVCVIREENGNRVLYMHDIRSTDIFNSPCWYLHQNDMIYVQPKYRKMDREDVFWKYFTSILSVVATASSVAMTTYYINK